jgi:tetratricopeptide (TPR) repeat protein
MASTEETEAIEQVTGILFDAFNQGSRGLVVVRCASVTVVDAARETLMRARAPFPWKSLPLAELSPPDLLGFLGFRGKSEGPAFLAYGLPITREGGILPEFLENLERNAEEYTRRGSLCVILATMAEMRAINSASPSLWAAKSGTVAWPSGADTSRFVPARFEGGDLANQAFGGVTAQKKGGVTTIGSGNVELKVHGNIALEPGIGPWSGAPLDDDGEVPTYVLESPAPAGRRWGNSLVMDTPELGESIDEARRLLDALQVELARQELAQAARGCREGGYLQAEAECYVLLGKAAEIRIDFSVAFDWYKLAMSIYERSADFAGYSDCCGFIAYMHFMQGDIAGAERSINWGLARDEGENDRMRIAAGNRRLGVIAEIKKELEEASEYFKKAGKIEQEIGDMHSYSRTLNHLARIARVQKRFEDAEKFLEESLVIKEELDDQPGLASGYHEMGNLFLNGQRFEEARQSYEEALRIEVTLRDIPGIAVTQAQLGLVNRQLLQFNISYECLAIARALMRKLKSPNIVAVDAVIEDVYTMVDLNQMAEIEADIDSFLQGILND